MGEVTHKAQVRSGLTTADEQSQLHRERRKLLAQLENTLEIPMLVFGFVWLGLLVAELIWGLTPLLEGISTAIWVVFVLDFALKLVVATNKVSYLKSNWLTCLALLLPALRVFRVMRVLRLLRIARAARGVRLFRLIASMNRGIRALRATLTRRGFSYVLILTLLVVLGGSAGMFALEREAPGGSFSNYADALWWTAMLMTTAGSEYWPKTAEGRVLCLCIALYAFAVFGYFTATLATFFIGRDSANPRTEVAGSEQLRSLHADIALLRREVQAMTRARPETVPLRGEPAPSDPAYRAPASPANAGLRQ